MGSYTFSWEHAANEVFVTGDFDDWKKTVKLEKEGDVFRKTVELPKAKTQYKFVVDGDWVTNDSAPKEDDGKGIFNNVLVPDDIKEPVSTLSSAAPESTTAALAAQVPKEDSGPTHDDSLPGAFPLTPPADSAANEPQAFSINPIPATEGLGNPVKLAPGEPVPEPSTLTSNTVDSTVKHDKEPEEEPEQKVSVAPIPATAGAGNPIKLAPGEPVPDASTLTSNTISSTAKTDEASYNKLNALPPQLGPVITPEVEREANGGMFGLPPLTGSLIPESSLPNDTAAKSEQDPGVTIQSAAPTSTTAALAGEVPREPKVPEAVTASQKEAGFAPEAAANAEAVEEKNEVEQELKAKIPEEPPAADGTTSVTAKASEAASAGATAAAAGATAAAGAAVIGAVAAKDTATETAVTAKDKAVETAGLNGKAAGTVDLNGQATASEIVPPVVVESQKEAHASPEAAANPVAVEEKKEVEAELLKEVKKTNEAGEPAPIVTAVTSATAPALSGEALADSKPLQSSGEADGLNAPASKPAQSEPAKPATDSGDVSPLSKQPTVPAPDQQEQPVATTGILSDKTETQTEAKPETAAPTTSTEASKDAPAEAPKSALTETPKTDAPAEAAPKTSTAAESSKDTPAESVASGNTDKKKKRRSFFGKLKDKLSSKS